MTKVIFFDVDGTLLSHSQKCVPESSKCALDALAKKGIKRVLATGRHTLELDQLPLEGLDFDGYILLNGHLCLDERKDLICGIPIEGTDRQMLLKIFQEKTFPLVLVEQDRMYINYVNRDVELAQQAISTPLPPVETYRGAPIYQAVAYLPIGEEQILPQLLPGCKAARWSDWGLDVFSAKGGKTVGIQKYLDANGVDQANTMAFGDGENDAGMLQFVGFGVAMGNAVETTKQSADYITDSVDQDGIWNALVKLKLIDPA
jgi:Cof subfamily protein (haloacid dehalogenase superfamily)